MFQRVPKKASFIKSEVLRKYEQILRLDISSLIWTSFNSHILKQCVSPGINAKFFLLGIKNLPLAGISWDQTLQCMNSDHTFWFQITLFARCIYLLCDRSFSFAICSCVYNGISESWNEVSIGEVFSIPYSSIHVRQKFVISDKNTWLMQGMKLFFFFW